MNSDTDIVYQTCKHQRKIIVKDYEPDDLSEDRLVVERCQLCDEVLDVYLEQA
jgi:hypothetical protein